VALRSGKSFPAAVSLWKLVKRRKSAALPEVQANLDDQKNISGIEQADAAAASTGKRKLRFMWDSRFEGWFMAEQQFAMTAPRDYTGLLVNGSGL
jgi:hypothetical protein